MRHVKEMRDGARSNDPRCPAVPLMSAVHVKSGTRVEGNNVDDMEETDEADEADDADGRDGVGDNQAGASSNANSKGVVQPVGEIRGVDEHCWSIYTKLHAKRGPAYQAIEDLERRFADLKGLKRLLGEYVLTSIEHVSSNACASFIPPHDNSHADSRIQGQEIRVFYRLFSH